MLNFKWRSSLLAFSLSLFIMALLGCSSGKRPFLIAQICLKDEEGISGFMSEMRFVAESRNMAFVDSTAETRRDLEVVDAGNGTGIDISRTIDFHITRADGMGIGVGNLGLPNYQLALGFSEGSDAIEARRFADEVVSRLRRRWRVEIVPPGRGALPISDC